MNQPIGFVSSNGCSEIVFRQAGHPENDKQLGSEWKPVFLADEVHGPLEFKPPPFTMNDDELAQAFCLIDDEYGDSYQLRNKIAKHFGYEDAVDMMSAKGRTGYYKHGPTTG